jgi:D-serine deaminase-like pyridoxal phosphate-dependent protein
MNNTMHLQTPKRPVLLLNETKCRSNIKNMVKKSRENSCQLRPHFKTHQSIKIGRWFREQGVTGITVSTPQMGAYFAEDGWDDITLAFPFYRAQLSSIKQLQDKASLRLFIHNEDDLLFLNRELDAPIEFYVELDNGYKRSGVSTAHHNKISAMIETADTLDKVSFHGFYMHDGRTYQSRSKEEILQSIEISVQLMKKMKNQFPQAAISLGDTPSASALPSFEFLDECTAGNFVFYDWMQHQIGSCSVDDIALYHLLPVAQSFPEENRAICHGGAVHCSKDYVSDNGVKNYGQLISFNDDGSVKVLDGLLESLSQEHGMLRVGENSKKVLNEEFVCIIPIHSCLTANLYDHYITTDGEIIKKRILS